jgi:hypothetical protein
MLLRNIIDRDATENEVECFTAGPPIIFISIFSKVHPKFCKLSIRTDAPEANDP